MESIFDATSRAQVLARIEQLRADTPAQWGKMNAPQVLAHCSVAFDSAFGKIGGKQIFLGKLFGKMAKKKLVTADPFGKSSPTSSYFIINDQRDFDTEKQKLIQQIKNFGEGGPAVVTKNKHAFYGDMSTQDWDLLMYKHLDHHLRQFGV
jgi:hypothetical protein